MGNIVKLSTARQLELTLGELSMQELAIAYNQQLMIVKDAQELLEEIQSETEAEMQILKYIAKKMTATITKNM